MLPGPDRGPNPAGPSIAASRATVDVQSRVTIVAQSRVIVDARSHVTAVDPSHVTAIAVQSHMIAAVRDPRTGKA